MVIKEDSMGPRSEALAKQFEAKVQEAVAVIEPLSDTNWTQVTETEHWTVGVTADDHRAAHHRRPDRPYRHARRQHPQDGRELMRAPSGVRGAA